VAFIAGVLFWFATGQPILEARDALIVLTTGVITVWSLFLYFKALADEETTTIIILFQTLPIFSLIFGYFILGETISPMQFVGFILVIAAALGVTMKPKIKGERIISKAFFLILIFNIMWALAGVLIKFAINANSFSEILSYESWGIAIGGALVFIFVPSIRRNFMKNLKQIKARVLTILFVNEGIFVIAKSISFSAFAMGPVALVSVLNSTQVFYGILYGVFLTKALPKLFKEDVSRSGIVKKIGFAVIMFLGIVLISF
jgi:drug/metabolite transporter (DMT)-like permease